jgi:hypothetical protein
MPCGAGSCLVRVPSSLQHALPGCSSNAVSMYVPSRFLELSASTRYAVLDCRFEPRQMFWVCRLMGSFRVVAPRKMLGKLSTGLQTEQVLPSTTSCVELAIIKVWIVRGKWAVVLSNRLCGTIQCLCACTGVRVYVCMCVSVCVWNPARTLAAAILSRENREQRERSRYAASWGKGMVLDPRSRGSWPGTHPP